MAPPAAGVNRVENRFQALRDKREAEERAHANNESLTSVEPPQVSLPAAVVEDSPSPARVPDPVSELVSVSASVSGVSVTPVSQRPDNDPEPAQETPSSARSASQPSSDAPRGAATPQLSDELADEVNDALRPIGYPWPGGVVLTDVDDPRAQYVIEANLGFGMLVDGVGWVSLISPVGGLILPDNVPLEPVPKVWGKWVSMHGGVDGKVMGVFALNRKGRVVGATGTAKRSDLAVPLTMATLRTLEDRDDIPESAGDLVAPGTTRWAQGWSFSREKLLADMQPAAT